MNEEDFINNFTEVLRVCYSTTKVMIGNNCLSLIKSPLFGNRLISVPFLDFSQSFNSVQADKLVLLSESLGVDFVEVRNPRFGMMKGWSKGFERRVDYYDFIIDLSKSEEELWKGLKKSVRNDITKAKKRGVIVKKRDILSVNTFYDMYLTTMKRLGSPPHKKRYFKMLMNYCNALLFISYQSEKAITAHLFLPLTQRVYYAYNCAVTHDRTLRGSDLALWESFLYLKRMGYTKLHLGRTRPSSGVYDYKNAWGGTVVSLPYYYYWNKKELKERQEVTYEWASKAWNKLVPTTLTKIIGPWIIKQVG